jgi:hypothetical protein
MTVLTPYSGQKFEIKRAFAASFKGRPPRIVTIDDYQGEENDIIILSLVRSNKQKKLGFIKIENRIIVALSRARHGMYIIGNSQCIGTDNIWFRIMSTLKALECLGPLPLACQNHPKNIALISEPADFVKKAPKGGCHEPCRWKLDVRSFYRFPSLLSHRIDHLTHGVSFCSVVINAL